MGHKKRSKKEAPSGRSRLTIGALAALFLAAGYTQAKVQLFDRESVLDNAEGTRRYEIEKDDVAQRGTIFSADGRVLAQSEDAYELGIRFDRVPQSPGFLVAVARETGLAEIELDPPSAKGRQTRTWRKVFTADQAARIKQVKRAWRADGISLTPILDRSYPLGEAASGIVGMVRNREAVTGLELSQNGFLAGRDGSVKGYVDRTGMFLPNDEHDAKRRVNGQSLTLTIDSKLQQIATLSIRAAVEKHEATSGCALVLDPKTGYLLAMANWPSVDPGARLKPGQEFNAAYMNVLEPGSTFKILTLARALDENKVSLGSGISCGGQMMVVKGHAIHCAHGAHGQLNLTGAIARSCNVAASQWALKVGRESMIEYLKELGLLNKTELGLPLERAGLFNFKDGGQRLQLANVGFGQALSVTPVSLISAFGMFANDGIRMKPQLVKARGEHVNAPVSEGGVISKATAAEVLRMMESTIESDNGTGSKLRVPGYRLAGKTGTAQKLIHGKIQGYVSSFVGYVPSESPRAVILVMVNDPKVNGIYGGDVAGPVFTDLAKALISRYNIAPQNKVASGGTLKP